MSGDLFVLGLSWRTAKVDMRERLAFTDEQPAAALADLLAGKTVGEAMILSTCNRVEIYGATPRGPAASTLTAATAEARRYLSATKRVSGEELSNVLYEHTDEEAVRHAFRVAAALDSMVVGEAQILGQLKSAFGQAEKAGATGPVIRRWMERAFGVAKRVRTDTAISRGAANVSSVAVELALRVFGDLSGKTVLVVGAGKMSALAARHLRANGTGSLLVTNRSPEKAEQVAAEVDGLARPWAELESLLALADVVISSTGAQEPILTKKLIKGAMKKRRYRPQVICDIAVPRDAAAEVGRIDGVYLFDIDDLQKVVAENLKERARHADDAVAIVEQEVGQFTRWLETQAVVPTIRALREHFAAVATAEADKIIATLDAADSREKLEQSVRRLSQLIANKLLHPAMVALKDNEHNNDLEELAAATRKLFALELEADRPAESDPAVEKREPA